MLVEKTSDMTEMSLSSFQYSQRPEHNVRLLTVTGLGSDGTIECTLDTNELTESLDFYALSYAWGSSLKNRLIRCNGSDLAVTQSVHEALIALLPTLEHDKLPIWIDAVCINQSNNQEKEREVQRMDKIYSSAKTVLVWLGPEAQDSAMAMRHIQSFAIILSKMEVTPLWSNLEVYGLPHQDHPVWPAIGHLYRRAWFGRVWTFQESVLAQDMKVFCGGDQVDWKYFSQVGSDISRLQLFHLAVSEQDLLGPEHEFFAVRDVSYAKNFKRRVGDDIAKLEGQLEPKSPAGILYSSQAAHIPFPFLLMISQQKLSSDPRDRVYGMLSLTSGDFRSKIPVSYSKSKRQLFLETGKASLEQDKRLTYLQLVAGRPRSQGLPTWCFDLSESNTGISPFGLYLRAGSQAETDFTSGATLRTFTGKEYIETVGFRADKIDQIVPAGTSFRTGPRTDRKTRWYAWHQKSLQLAESIRDRRSGIDFVMAHAYTVTANTISRVPDGAALKRAIEDVVHNVVSQIERADNAKRYWFPKERKSLVEDTAEHMFHYCSGRSFFTTVGGRLGIGPPDVQPGDIVIVIYGAGPVFLLRESAELSAFEFVGDAFVHELMELSRTPEDAIGPTETFRIV